MDKKGLFNKINLLFFRVLFLVAGPIALMTAAMPAYGEIVQTAVVATVAADYSGSAISIVPVDQDEGTRTAENELLAQSTSDITVDSFGRYFYLIAKYGTNSVAKFDIGGKDNQEWLPIWQFSTEGDDTNSNPYDMVFVNSEKAYLLRYGSTKVWIVNPSATSEEGFKIGELDLSAYDDGDGAPEMTGGVIVGGKIFIMMQRLTYWAPTDAKPYVAVYDIETDEEIDTGMDEGDLLGIPLDIWDPLAIQYLAENDTIYVQGIGAFPGYGYPDYEDKGGIVSIDPVTYDTEMILDDGETGDMPYGNISGMAIVSPTKGYFVGYAGWGDNTLYSFDPSAESPTGTAVSGLENKSIAGMESGIYTDKNNMLWVCNQTDAQIEVIDTSTDTIDESVGTSLNPLKAVFTTQGVVEDDTDNNGIADAQEVDSDVDLDGDETDDVITDTYKFLQTEIGEAQVAMEGTENVNSLLTIASIDPADALGDSTGDPPDEMPYGLIDFSLDVPTGATAQVTLYFSETVSESAWYKYSSETGWEDYSDNAVFSEMTDGRTQVVLTLVDGGDGDSDGLANGIITDPSGPGSVTASGSSATSNDDSGCFIGTAADGKGMTMQPLLFILLLGASIMSLIALRRSCR